MTLKTLGTKSLSSPLIGVQREKNQITIPQVIVDKIGAKKGTKYVFSVTDDGFSVKKVKNRNDYFLGIIKSDKSAMELIQEARQIDER